MSDWFDFLPQLQGPALLVTLVALQGSNYRRPGARLLVRPDGSTLGLLSGGCLEEVVAQRVRHLWHQSEAMVWHLDTRPFSGCDGRLTLLAECNPVLLSQVAERLRQRQRGGFLVSQAQGTQLQEAPEDQALLCQELLLPIRLLVIGGGPDSQALVQLAQQLPWQVEHLCHPEHKFPIPGCRALAPEALQARAWDGRCAVVLLNHHLGRDAAYLRALWSLPLGYLACIGSRVRREELLQALWHQGLEPQQQELFCPAGLALGGEGPQAVALAVLAQIQQRLGR